MNAPDYVSPVVGYRAWGFDPRGLKSINGEIWRPNETLQAACRRSKPSSWSSLFRSVNRHTPPHRNCSCGIYAAKSFDQLREIGYATPGVHGEVYLWGTVVEHKLGWRAQFAYPKTLVVHPAIVGLEPNFMPQDELESLRILIGYGADLFVAGEKGNIPLWTKQCRGFDHVREVVAGFRCVAQSLREVVARLAQSRHSERFATAEAHAKERLEKFAAAEALAKEIYQTHLRAILDAAIASRDHRVSDVVLGLQT